MEKEPSFEHFPTEKKLHADILEEKYGPIHAEVLRHDDSIRESHLKDEKGVSRTYALTFFPDKLAEDITPIDQEIRSGGLIGKTFRDHGYEIRKNVLDVFVLRLPKWLKRDFATDDKSAKARVTEFYAKKEGLPPVIYGMVLEVYSPDFKEAEINEVDKDQINPTTRVFQQLGVDMEKVWNRLPQASQKNEWVDLGDKYEQAKKSSEEEVKNIRSKIDRYLRKKEQRNHFR